VLGGGIVRGSLVNYVLEITDLDPIKWDLPFSRFLSVHRCLEPNTRVLLEKNKTTSLDEIKVGDKVLTQDGSLQRVTYKTVQHVTKTYLIKVNGTTFKCSENHEWLVCAGDGKFIKKRTHELTTDDLLYTYHYDHSKENL
jgi:hypothetical protein